MVNRPRSSWANWAAHGPVEVGALVSGPAIRELPTALAQASHSGRYWV